ncbi:helix-turn-helix domain-containing protein [Polymorphospora rubra]|uniref:HTH domain-containing protein n=1 Tax=Polymorphospora rubra TaxID=338584 RepID=A0A810N450_9ACTN|nr:helix-turn-helix domain-containing protein [Polymorphospora rubra]BCJ66265.1 HTH domain-containing protein [Polymorphospora rubra]
MEADELMSLVKVAGDDDPKRALAATAAARRELERLEAVQVRRARAQGGTWAEIATALGVSKQAVHKKYGGHGLFHSER